MAKPPNGADTVFSALFSAAHDGQDQITQRWSEHCDLYARYFAALSKAHEPEDLLAANTQLALGGLDALARRSATLSPASAVAQPQG